MRASSTMLQQVITGASFSYRYVADVFLNGQRVMQDLPCTEPDFTDDGSQQVQSTGSLTFVYQGDFADSIAPSSVADVLSPFGTQVWVYVLISDGPGFSERVTLGHYMVTENPTISSTRMLFRNVPVTIGETIRVTLMDLFYGVQVNRFYSPGSPSSTASTWNEVRRLTGLPVTVTAAVPDGGISSKVAYQEDRLQAVYDLANYSLDATPYVTPDGTVSMRPNNWGAAVDTLSAGDGNLIDVERSMNADDVYNAIAVRSYNTADGTAILATGEVRSGPLRASETSGALSPFRRRPQFYSSQYITTPEQAAAYVNRWLPRISQLSGIEFTLTETFNPLREVGDVLTVNEVGEAFRCRVSRIHRTGAAQQQTTVEVQS